MGIPASCISACIEFVGRRLAGMPAKWLIEPTLPLPKWFLSYHAEHVVYNSILRVLSPPYTGPGKCEKGERLNTLKFESLTRFKVSRALWVEDALVRSKTSHKVYKRCRRAVYDEMKGCGKRRKIRVEAEEVAIAAAEIRLRQYYHGLTPLATQGISRHP